MLLPVKVMTLAPDVEGKSWTESVSAPMSGDSKPSQTMNGKFVANIQMQSQTFPSATSTGDVVEKRLIHLDLNGSFFGAGSPFLNQKDMRGLFVEWLRYEAWVQDPALAWDPSNAHPDWAIEQEAPTTANASGSISSSISFGFDASAGSFAGDPTANVSASMSVSSSHSHTITDYTFSQHSDLRVLRHWLQMTQTNDGHPYTSAGDLVDTDGGGADSALGARLRPLSPIATSNLPLVSQAVWMNKSDAGLVPKLLVVVRMTPHYLLTEATSHFFDVKHANMVRDYMWIRSNVVDFSLLTK